MQEVSSGQKFRPVAEEWNRVRRAAEAVGTGGAGDARALPPGVVLVRNDGEASLPDRAAVGLGAAVVPPASADDPAFRGAVPCLSCEPWSEDALSWGVLLAPLAPGAIGRAAVFGLVLARVVWKRDAPPVAGPEAGEEYPVAGAAGASVVWLDEANASDGETVWALLALGAGGGGDAVPARITGWQNGVYTADLHANGPDAARTGTGTLVLPEVQQFTRLANGTWVLGHPVAVSVERHDTEGGS